MSVVRKRLWYALAVLIVAVLFTYISCLPSARHTTYLPPEAALAAPRLARGVNLEGRDLIEVPEYVRQLPSLERIRLDNNKVDRLPDWLVANERIDIISLRLNRLSHFPPELARMVNLRKLCLADNDLSQLPASIGDLTSLTDLDVRRNQLVGLPPEISRLQALQDFSVADNKIADLPSEIGQLASLETLELDNNLLHRLPPEIGRLRRLKWLTVTNNCLTDFPDDISHLAGSLTSLRVAGNRLSIKAREELRRLLPHTTIEFGEMQKQDPDVSGRNRERGRCD